MEILQSYAKDEFSISSGFLSRVLYLPHDCPVPRKQSPEEHVAWIGRMARRNYSDFAGSANLYACWWQIISCWDNGLVYIMQQWINLISADRVEKGLAIMESDKFIHLSLEDVIEYWISNLLIHSINHIWCVSREIAPKVKAVIVDKSIWGQVMVWCGPQWDCFPYYWPFWPVSLVFVIGVTGRFPSKGLQCGALVFATNSGVAGGLGQLGASL